MLFESVVKLKFHLKDFMYFGLQNGNECHCGNDSSKFLPTYHSQCNQRCVGDKSQFCGGSWRLNVYQNQQAITNEALKGFIIGRS